MRVNRENINKGDGIMATRSNIVLNKDEKYYVIYANWDGYPSYNGKILLEYYTDSEKIWALIQLGSILGLGSKIGDKHDFNNPPKDTVNAYFRDKEEDWEGTKYKTFDNLEDALEICNNDYTYLFKDEKWTFRKWDGKFHELTKAVVLNEG